MQLKTDENAGQSAPLSPPAEPAADIRLDQTQLAARWNISPRTLERWRWLNQGPAFLKIGRRVAYQLEDVKAYEAARRRAPGAMRDPLYQGQC